MPAPDCWIYHYQTLVTGLLAVAAGGAAVIIGHRQVKAARDQLAEAKRQADVDRAGKLRAARASLPTALGAVARYAVEAGQALHLAWPTPPRIYAEGVRANQRYTVQASMPQFPTDVIPVLERIVELTDVEAVAERVESILREVQVLSARTVNIPAGEQISLEWLASHILQAAAIYARTETLFTYARRKTETLNTVDMWDRAFAALKVMRIEINQVHELARKQRDGGFPPGEADSEEPV